MLWCGAAPIVVRGQPRRDLASSFRQEFNSYQWNWRVAVEQPWVAGWKFVLREDFTSSLLALAQQADRWKDDQRLTAALWRPLGMGWSVKAGGRAFRYWDRQSGLANDYSEQELFIGIDAEPSPAFLVQLEAGPKRDVRYTHRDWGGGWRLAGEMRGVEWNGYRQVGLASWDREILGPRRNEDLRFLYRIGRTFQPGTADTIEVRWDRLRRDNYVSPSLDREHFMESAFSFDNRMHYAISDVWSTDVRTAFRYEGVQVRQLLRDGPVRSRRRRESYFQNLLRLRRSGARSQSIVEFLYRARTARYRLPEVEAGTPFSRRLAFVAPDSRSRFFSLGLQHRLAPGTSDSLSVVSRMSRLQYDTPDTNNFDDHDELRIDVAGSWKHYLSRQLKIELRAGIGLYHLVYIFGQRSADNNWNRVFRLAPAVEVRPGREARLLHRFEVSANYVDYDFEDVLGATRSFVYRRFVMGDSAHVGIGRLYRVLAVLQVQLEENGRLYWDTFEERPLIGRKSLRLRLIVRRKFGRNNYLYLGFTYYERREDRFEQAPVGRGYRKAPLRTFISKGPVLGFTLWGRRSSWLQAHVHRQRVSLTGTRSYYTNNIELLLHWGF